MQCFALLCVLELPSLALPLKMKSGRALRCALCVVRWGVQRTKEDRAVVDDQGEEG